MIKCWIFENYDYLFFISSIRALKFVNHCSIFEDYRVIWRDWQRFWFFRIYFIIFEIWNFSSSNVSSLQSMEKNDKSRESLFSNQFKILVIFLVLYDTLKHSFDIHWLHSWISVIHDVRSALDFAGAKELKNRFPLISQWWSLL